MSNAVSFQPTRAVWAALALAVAGVAPASGAVVGRESRDEPIETLLGPEWQTSPPRELLAFVPPFATPAIFSGATPAQPPAFPPDLASSRLDGEVAAARARALGEPRYIWSQHSIRLSKLLKTLGPVLLAIAGGFFVVWVRACAYDGSAECYGLAGFGPPELGADEQARLDLQMLQGLAEAVAHASVDPFAIPAVPAPAIPDARPWRPQRAAA